MSRLSGISAFCALAFWAALSLPVFLTGLDAVRAQSAPPPQATPLQPQPAPAEPPASAPGLLDKLGDMIRETVDDMSSNLKASKGTANPNAGNAGASPRFPSAGIVTGRIVCPMAANGAPDCQSAVDSLCKSKGYATGASLGSETAETCAPRVYVPGYQRKPGDCSMDTFVTRAACN